jgi:hypothetical protein
MSWLPAHRPRRTAALPEPFFSFDRRRFYHRPHVPASAEMPFPCFSPRSLLLYRRDNGIVTMRKNIEEKRENNV